MSSSGTPPSSDEEQEDDFFQNVQRLVTQEEDPQLAELFESAKAGNVDDFVSLAQNLCEEKREGGGLSSRFPPDVKGKAFDLFVSQIRKPCVKDDTSQLRLTAQSLAGLEALWEHRAASWLPQIDRGGASRARRAWKFAILWTDIFRWLEVLVQAFFDDEIDEDTAIYAITTTFVLFRDLDLIHTNPIFEDPDVFKLAFRLWLRDLVADDDDATLWSEPLAITCTKQMDMNEDNAPLLEVAVEEFRDFEDSQTVGKNGEIARIAIGRLVAALEKSKKSSRVKRVMDAVRILWLIAKENDAYGNKREFSSNPKGIPSVIRAMNVIVGSFVWDVQMEALHRALDLLQTQVIVDAVNDESAVTDRMVVLLQNDILTTLVKVRQSCAGALQGKEECILLILLKVKDLLAKSGDTAARISAAAKEDARKLGRAGKDVKVLPDGSVAPEVEALLRHIASTVVGNTPVAPTPSTSASTT